MDRAGARKRLAQYEAFVQSFDRFVAASADKGNTVAIDLARRDLYTTRNRLGNIQRLEAAARK